MKHLPWAHCLLIIVVFFTLRSFGQNFKVTAFKEDGVNYVYSVTPEDTTLHGYDFLTLQQLDTVLKGGKLDK